MISFWQKDLRLKAVEYLPRSCCGFGLKKDGKELEQFAWGCPNAHSTILKNLDAGQLGQAGGRLKAIFNKSNVYISSGSQGKKVMKEAQQARRRLFEMSDEGNGRFLCDRLIIAFSRNKRAALQPNGFEIRAYVRISIPPSDESFFYKASFSWMAIEMWCLEKWSDLWTFENLRTQ